MSVVHDESPYVRRRGKAALRRNEGNRDRPLESSRVRCPNDLAERRRALAAAVLDVFDPEPLSPESPLWDLPGVYVSAHTAVSVDRYMDDVFDLVLDNVERYRAGRELRNVVDMAQLGFR